MAPDSSLLHPIVDPLPYEARLEARALDQIDLVVIHCTELPDLATAREYGERILHASGTGNCGHYYIDRDGAVHVYVRPDRVAHHEELRKIIEEWTAKYTVQENFDMVDGAGVPRAPIYSIDQVVKDPHIAGDRKMFVETEHPVTGKITLTGSHLKLSETCTDIRTPSPALGQDNAVFLLPDTQSAGRLLDGQDARLQVIGMQPREHRIGTALHFHG